MKKKIFIVQMLDSKNPSGKSFTQVNDALFYSNDTDAHLVFLPHEQERFEFNEATVALYNIDDESLVERPAVIETFEGRKSVVLKMTEDLLAHWGRWQAQVVFKQGDKINTSVVVKFDTLRYMLDQRPPTLRDVIKVDELYSQLVTVMDEIAGKDVISAPEIILARGGFDTLGERLEDTDAQLAQIENGYSLPEIEEARGGENTLGERLDKEHNEVTAQLAQIGGVSVDMFGAVGDGETDDTLAFQNALNKGTKIIGDRDKTYFITQPLNVIFDNTEVDLRGAKIIYSHNQNAPHSVGRTGRINDVGIFNVKGATSGPSHNIDTASDFRLDLGRVTLLDYGEFEVGDVVALVVTTGTNNAGTLTPNVNILTKITETEGNVIKFDYFVPSETWDYSDYQITHASVTKVNPLKNVVIKNFTAYDRTPIRNGFVSDGVTQYPEADSHYAVGGIAVIRVENLKVENVSFNENMYNAIHALYVYNSSFSNIECYNPRLLAGGEGYLIQLMNYHKVWVDNLRASGVRHILDFTGGAYARAKDIFSYHSKQVPFTFHGAYDHHIEIDGLQGRTSGDGDRLSISYGAGYPFGNAISDITFKNSYLLLGYNCDRSEKFAKNITFEGCNIQMVRAPLQTIFNNCTVYMLRDTGDSPTNKRGSDVDSYLRFDNCEIINGYSAGEGIRIYMIERFDAIDINNSIIRDDFPRDDVRTTSFPVKNIKSFNVNNCRLYIAIRVYGNGTSSYANTQYRFNNNEFHTSRLGGVSLETIDGVPTTVMINANTFTPREAEGVSIRLTTVADWFVPLKLMITSNVAHAPANKGADLDSNTNIEYVIANNIGLGGL